MSSPKLHEFQSREDLATTLAAEVEKASIVEQKRAILAFSGGSTPERMLGKINRIDNSIILLVDDRWVDTNSSRSNEAMLRKQLGISQSITTSEDLARMSSTPSPAIVPLYRDGVSAAEACFTLNMLVDDLNIEVPDMCILGMGTDGHTASWFPGGDNLSAATAPNCKDHYMPMTAPGAQEPRITMTLPFVASSKKLILHIEGAEKRSVLEQALQDGPADELPVRHILRKKDANLQIYWAP